MGKIVAWAGGGGGPDRLPVTRRGRGPTKAQDKHPTFGMTKDVILVPPRNKPVRGRNGLTIHSVEAAFQHADQFSVISKYWRDCGTNVSCWAEPTLARVKTKVTCGCRLKTKLA